jgi:membrane protein DedA with SNARE-associated domain
MKRWIRNALVALLVIFPAVFITASYLEDLVETNGQEGSTRLVARITSLPTTAINLATGAGYGGIFLLMLLESASFPVPSEVILPLAGYLVFRGTLQFWPTVFYSTVAALMGSFVDYYLGVKLGSPLLTGQTKLPYVRAEHLKRVQAWFGAYGPAAVAFLRLVPTARVLISFPAGASRMRRSKFALCTLLGCLPWNITLVYVGWWLGSSWEEATAFFRYIDPLVYLVMILLVIWVAWRVSRGKRK